MAIWSMTMGSAHADPFVGEARVVVDDTNASNQRTQALVEARTEALRAAIADLSLERTPAAAEVLANPQPWTAAYRVLEQTRDGDEMVLRLEVDIDVPRLAKRLQPPRPGSSGGYRIGRVDGLDACLGVDRARVVEPLAALGLVTEAGDRPELSLSLECRALGKVAFTYLHAATVTVVASGPQGVLTRRSDTAFADDAPGATAAALHGALSDVAARIAARGEGRLVLVVERPWPAPNVRKLQAALADAVLGVRAVALDGIERNGAVRLRIDGDLDARELVRQLEAMHFSGFELADLTVETSHAVHVRLQ